MENHLLNAARKTEMLFAFEVFPTESAVKAEQNLN